MKGFIKKFYQRNEFIPVVKNIIADFNLTNNIKS